MLKELPTIIEALKHHPHSRGVINLKTPHCLNYILLWADPTPVESFIFFADGQAVRWFLRAPNMTDSPSSSPLPTETSATITRFHYTHTLRALLNTPEKTDALYTHMQLQTAMQSLLRGYIQARNHAYHGDAASLAWIRQNDFGFYVQMEDFYTTTDTYSKLQILEVLTEMALAPVGGLWQNEKPYLALDWDGQLMQADMLWQELTLQKAKA